MISDVLRVRAPKSLASLSTILSKTVNNTTVPGTEGGVRIKAHMNFYRFLLKVSKITKSNRAI